ncbi:hypothetical protein FKP32DRAFT_1671734 [Trametes sanguinea]|nr:hypothetical protein FKP32DRAFT_1671734 [Trametes sanguinea]
MPQDPTSATPQAQEETCPQKRTKTTSGASSSVPKDTPLDDRTLPRKQPQQPSADLEPIDVNPCERDTLRPLRPLPARAREEMTSIMHRFSPTNWENLPTKRKENPHFRMTGTGLPPAILDASVVNFTNTQFQHAHIPTFKFFGNVASVQENVLHALADSKIVLATVIHGGGQRYIHKSPERVDKIKKFLQSICFENVAITEPEVTVYVPEMRKESDKNRFGQPWTFFIELDEGSTLLRDYLLWQVVFALHISNLRPPFS